MKLIQSSFEDKNNPKKIQYHPHIFIIDETKINSNFDLDSVVKTAKSFNYPLYISSISTFLEKELTIYSSTDYKKGSEDAFPKILEQIPDASLRATFLKDVR